MNKDKIDLYKQFFVKHRTKLCIIIGFVSWICLLVNQAHAFINNPSLTEGTMITNWGDAFSYMFESTVIINLVIFLFPLSYLLLVYGNSRKYDSIKSVPSKAEFALGLIICIFSFFTTYITNFFKSTEGGYGVTEYMVFLIGISYLFFGYQGIKDFFIRLERSLSGKKIKDSSEQKKGILARVYSLITTIDLAFYFIIAMELIYMAYQSKFFESNIMRKLEPIEASLVAKILHLLHYPVTSYGNVISVMGLNGMTASFTIDWGCTGIISITIYSVLGSALILTVPSKAWKKWFCIVGGAVLLFFANILRLMTIALLGYYYNTDTAMTFHVYGGYIYFLLFVGIFWYVSLNYFLLKPEKKVKPKTETVIDKKIIGARKFTLDVGWVFSAIVVSMVVGLILKIMIANTYGPADMGLYSLMLVLYTLSYIIGELGVSATITKFIAEFKYNHKILKRYASTAFVNALIYGSILSVVVFILATPLAAMYHYPKLETMLRIVALIFPFLTMNNAIIGMFNGLRQMDKYSSCSIFRRVIVVVYTGICIMAGFNITGAVIALVLAEMSNFILAMYYGSQLFFPLDLSRFKAMTKKIWSYSWAVVTLNAVGQLNNRMDLLILAFFVSAETVGVYSVATTFAWFLPMIPSAIQTITYPMIARYNARKKRRSMERLVNTCMKFSMMFMIVLSFTFLFLGPKLLSLLFKNTKFSDAYIPMVILTCGLVVYGMVTSIGSAFLGIGKPSVSLKITLFITLPILIIGCLVLIPIRLPGMSEPLGMDGAAIATATSLIVSSIVDIFLLKKYTRIKIMWKQLGLVACSGAASAVVICLLYVFMSVFIAFTVGMLVFVVFVYFLNTITKKERILIKALVKSII